MVLLLQIGCCCGFLTVAGCYVLFFCSLAQCLHSFLVFKWVVAACCEAVSGTGVPSAPTKRPIRNTGSQNYKRTKIEADKETKSSKSQEDSYSGSEKTN